MLACLHGDSLQVKTTPIHLHMFNNLDMFFAFEGREIKVLLILFPPSLLLLQQQQFVYALKTGEKNPLLSLGSSLAPAPLNFPFLAEDVC